MMKPKIALVQCPPWTVLTPPLHLGYLAAFLRENDYPVETFDFNIETYDEESEENRYLWSRDLQSSWIEDKGGFLRKKIDGWAKRLLDSEADIIGISTCYDARHVFIPLINRIKEEDKSKLLVTGGPHCHPGHLREEFLNQKNVDVIVTGEGEMTLLNIAKQFKKKGEVRDCPGTIIRKGEKLVDCGPGPIVKNLDSLPFPDFSGIPLEKFVLKDEVPILFGRGCIGKCAFCQELPNLQPFRFRTARNIFEEIEQRVDQGYKVFFVNDLTANGNVRQLDKLSRLVIKSELQGQVEFTGQMRCRKQMTRKVYNNLSSAGWGCILYGVESGSQRILNLMNKGTKVKVIERNLRDAHEAGIETKVTLIVGFPGETEETFQKTLDFLKKNQENIDVLGSLYGLEMRSGCHVSTEPHKYSIQKEGEYWKAEDGRNNPGWRLELIRRLLEHINTLDIRVGFDDTHFYYTLALEYYHNHLKDYDKSYEIMMDALQHLSSKVKETKWLKEGE